MIQTPQKPPVRAVSPLARYASAERCSLPHEPAQPLPELRDIRLVLGVAGCAWLFLALASFNAQDSSFFTMVLPSTAGTNWCGALGAHCAAWLFVIAGPAAWVLVAMFLKALFVRSDKRAAYYVIQLLSGSVIISSLAVLRSIFHLGVAGGGIVGNGLCAYLSGIGAVGAGLLAGTTLFFSSLVFVRLTLRQFVYGITTALLYGFYGVSLTWYFLRTGITHLWPRSADAYNKMPPQPPVRPATQERVREQDVYHIPDVDPIPAGAHCPLGKKPELSEHIEISDIAEASAQLSSAAPIDGSSFAPQSVPHESFVFDDEEEEAQEDAVMFDGSEPSRGGDAAQTLAVEDDAEPLEEEDAEDEEMDDQDEEADDDDEGDDESGSGDGGGGFHGAKADQSLLETVEPQEPPLPFDLAPLNEIFDACGATQQDEAFMARCRERASILEEKLTHFGITGRVLKIKPGPVITLFEYEPEVGTKVSRILALEDDLALSLKALSIRILAPIPGESVVGFEIANEKRDSVMFGDLIGQEGLAGSRAHLPLALGVDITGNPVIADLATMPHLLVAGATGSGKSVGMNVMLVSLLARVTPDKVRMILIDPKRLEFAPYADIPHLLFPIVTNPADVGPVLKWVAEEMELRYELMAQVGVRNIAEYHKLDKAMCFAKEREIGIHVHGMPYMVIMIDELADLMMVGGREIETLIARIAQMARAAGIHMIVATQRPSVDVVTGLIKANFPSRVAFRVSSKIDSRTILDTSGAEKLLGRGDMLYMSPSSMGGVQRLHGAYVTDAEIDRLTDYLKALRPASYFSLKQVVAQHTESDEDLNDPLYDEVREFLLSVDEISISLLQRKYRVGFNRSARLIEMLERDGYVAAAQGGKPRRVLRD
ncbi:MAG: segregation ATPase FtsK/SpoIIIE, family [Candidatus Dependentiae bacterium]|nr:segregation ATPase FtsK/SpoIIIE, family [Candidatus Dependentiae bacterium]